jgi:hypothetical protein
MTYLMLDLRWESRDPSQADDARRLSQFVTGLPDFDPIYRSWLLSPKTKKETVPVPLTKGAAKQLLIDKMNRSDVDGSPLPKLGSDIRGGHAGPAPYDFRKSSYADTWCHVGGFGPPGMGSNLIWMRLSELRPSTGRPWRASELRPLMRFAREIWNPAEMSAMFSFYDPPRIPDRTWAAGERFLRPWIGWITTCLLISPPARNIPPTSKSKSWKMAPCWSLCAKSRSRRATSKAWRECMRSRLLCG